MFRVLVTSLMICTAVLSVDAGQKPRPRRDPWAKPHAEKHFKTLMAAIANSKELVIYEGLPHQSHEKAALAVELKKKRNVTFQDFPFYEEKINAPVDVAQKLTALCRAQETFGKWTPSACGGFHPDWCLEFRDGEETVQVLICFGCADAWLFGSEKDVVRSLSPEVKKTFYELLAPLRKNRPPYSGAGFP